MSVLNLLFPFDELELKSSFSIHDFGSYGITFADGTRSDSVSGSVIFHGAAFDFEIGSSTTLEATHHIFCQNDESAVKSVLGLGLGAAVTSGQMVPSVVTALLELGAIIGSRLGAKAAFWKPSTVMSGFDYFAEAVAQYADGAAFPSLVCVGFDTSGDEQISTSGLEWFCGQELVFELGTLPVNEAMRYVVRLVHDMAVNGAVDRLMAVPSLNDNEILELRPETNPPCLIVRRKHIQNGLNSIG